MFCVLEYLPWDEREVRAVHGPFTFEDDAEVYARTKIDHDNWVVMGLEQV
jgi:hypothetical protein